MTLEIVNNQAVLTQPVVQLNEEQVKSMHAAIMSNIDRLTSQLAVANTKRAECEAICTTL